MPSEPMPYFVDGFYAYYRGWRLDLSMGEEMLNRAMDEIDRMLARRWGGTAMTADSHSGVPVEGPDWKALEREWLDATPPAGHPLIHGIFQRLPDRLAPFLAAAPREASEPDA